MAPGDDSIRLGGPDPMAALTRFVGEGAVEFAARSRSRTRWQRELAVGESTWLGLLRELAETQVTTLIDTTIGRRLRGSITAVGSDFVTVTTTIGGHVLVAIAAISAIQQASGNPAGTGAGATGDLTTLHELLAELAVDQPRVTWHLTDRTSITGQLIGVARGFVQLRDTGTPPSTNYVPIGDRTMIAFDG
jgi:hypothetical protein